MANDDMWDPMVLPAQLERVSKGDGPLHGRSSIGCDGLKGIDVHVNQTQPAGSQFP